MSALKVFDIFVNPSYTEGIPTSVIEAALCKKAIIATNVGGTKETISGKNDGLLIAPKDVPALVSHLELLIENKELRATLGENAFQTVNEKFNWNHAAEQYLEVFKKLNT